MKTRVYFRSMEKSLTIEDVVRENILNMLDKFDRLKFGEVVIRITRVKGSSLFKYPKFLCEAVLRFGKRQIVVKKKSDSIEDSIIEARHTLEKAVRRSIKRDVQKRNHPKYAIN